jgi:hypothetical protein
MMHRTARSVAATRCDSTVRWRRLHRTRFAYFYSETPLEEIVAGHQHIGPEEKDMAIAYAVSEFLREHRIPYEVLWHPTADTSLRTAREAGVPSDRVVKAVVLESKGRIFMVLIPANRMIRMEAVEDYVGADVRIADPAVLESLFEDASRVSYRRRVRHTVLRPCSMTVLGKWRTCTSTRAITKS